MGSGAREVRTIALTPSLFPGVLCGVPVLPIPDGDYVLILHADQSVTASACRVRASQDTWQARFREMLTEQATLPGPSTRARQGGPLFSITTTVYDTLPALIEELRDCILGQTMRDFEWLVLDNGSTDEATREGLERIARRDRRIRLYSVPQNLHIIGGNRYLLERAKGEYIVPVDSDDLVYPDALRIIAAAIADNRHPQLLFTDEQKVSPQGIPQELVWKPQWSSLACLATCPAAHLMIFRRDTALKLGVYSDDYARGSHDWDTSMRFAEHDISGIHIPHVLYGWRMHPSSSALSAGTKDYLLSSQRQVIENSISRRGKAGAWQVVPVPAAPLGYYHVSRQTTGALPVVRLHVITWDVTRDAVHSLKANMDRLQYSGLPVYLYTPHPLPDSSASVDLIKCISSFRNLIRQIPYTGIDACLAFISRTAAESPYHALLNSEFHVDDPAWISEALATFDLDNSVGIVGGCLLDADGRVQHVGLMMGLDGFAATPGYGFQLNQLAGEIGRIRRHVTAVHNGLCFVKREVFESAGPPLGIDRSDAIWGLEWSLRAARHHFKIAYSPRTRAVTKYPLRLRIGDDTATKRDITQEYGSLISADPFYSLHCSAKSTEFGRTKG